MYDEETEKGVLYYLIFGEEEIALKEKDFYIKQNKEIIKAINELRINKKEISIISVNERVKFPNSLKYIADLGNSIQTSSFSALVESLKKYSKKRDIYEISKNITTEIQRIEDIDIYVEKQIAQFRDLETTEKEETFLEKVARTANEIEINMMKKEDYSFYTGFFDLDALTDGLHGGELTIIGARPAVGKTTFALQISEWIARKGKSVGYVSLEMSDSQIIQKLLSKNAMVNSRKLRSGKITQQEAEKIATACMKIGDLKFNIINKNSIQEIETIARKLNNKGELDLLVIDYLQLVKNNNKCNSREQEVADISRTLKLLALELQIPIIALCQLNRNATKAEPTLADIRESGSIEQDADNVIFLYQDVNELTNVDLQKQRNGNVGKIKLKFNKFISEFVNLER